MALERDQTPVAVIDGEIYPLENVSWSIERDTQDVMTRLGQNMQTITTSEEISGSFETYRRFAEMPPHLGKPRTFTAYFFPDYDDLSERYVMKQMMVSGTASTTNRETQTIDFVAMEVETD